MRREGRKFGGPLKAGGLGFPRGTLILWRRARTGEVRPVAGRRDRGPARSHPRRAKIGRGRLERQGRRWPGGVCALLPARRSAACEARGQARQEGTRSLGWALCACGSCPPGGCGRAGPRAPRGRAGAGAGPRGRAGGRAGGGGRRRRLRRSNRWDPAGSHLLERRSLRRRPPPPARPPARPRGPAPAPARPLGARGPARPQPPGGQEPQAHSAQPRDRVPSCRAWPRASQAALRRAGRRAQTPPGHRRPCLSSRPRPILARRGWDRAGPLSLLPATGLTSPVRARRQRISVPLGNPKPPAFRGPPNFLPSRLTRIPRSLASLAPANPTALGLP